MQTIQEYLKTADPDQLYDTYLEKYGTFASVSLANAPKEIVEKIQTYNEARRPAFLQYIRRLTELTPEPPEKSCILLCYPWWNDNDGFVEPMSDLFHKTDILEKDVEDLVPYAYEFMPQAEILAFLVAETSYTQHHIPELLADVLFEASWFGFQQEGLPEALDGLETARKEVEEGHTVPFNPDEFLSKEYREWEHEMQKELGKEGQELECAIHQAVNAFDRYARNVQLQKLKALLKEKM